MRGNPEVLIGTCPNQQCQKKLYFPEHEASVECTGCGQRHTQSVLKNLERTSRVNDWLGAIETLLRQIKKEASKKTVQEQENSTVNGLSNYLCTILSPLLATYGMDRTTGRAKLLTDMGKPPVFDCGQLGDRAFLIEPQHLAILGYGRDRSGSSQYLKDTLNLIKESNEREERLVPIHADGDGHCLVHAVSRALVGWELFWHPLRVNLKLHFEENLDKYKMQFQDFIDDSEWQLIIKECDPDFVPTGSEPTGLRNIHIFGLANVLKRPIILLDSIEGIQSPGDYSGRKCPVLSRHMIQRAWGVSDIEIDKYVTFDEQGNCQIGGEKVLQSGYFQRLVAAMSEVFFQKHGVSPSLISDVYQHIFKANGLMIGMNLNLLLDKTKTSISESRLFVCLNCGSLALANPISEEWLIPGGELFDLAISCHGKLKNDQSYSFPLHDVVAKYSASENKLIAELRPSSCTWCTGTKFRLVRADYTIEYKNGDRTRTKSSKHTSEFKHYWNGKEYDTDPKPILVLMEWGGQTVKKVVQWFQDEEDPSLNSNVYDIADGLVQEHFPGEFGSERLVQKVVDQILRQTNKPETDKTAAAAAGTSSSDAPLVSAMEEGDDDPSCWSPHRASKAILSGMQRQSVHKEELNKSAAERQVKQRIESNAPKQQRKLSDQSPTEKKHPPASTEPSNRKTPEKRSLASPSSPSSKMPATTSASATSPPPSSSGVSSKVDGGSTIAVVPPVNKRIRLSTSDGRNITLDLPSECKFLELQELIHQAIKVAPTSQRIRHGFPPRELKPPATPSEDYRVPIQPGDKIMLDIITPSQGQTTTSSQGATHSPTIDKSKIHGLPARRDDVSWTSFAEGGMDEVSDRVLQGLMDPLLTSGGDNLDHSLSALALTAALDNKDLWTYVQLRPHLFSVNGLFYKQVERDVGLEHGKHCQLPRLPHKVFVYNRFDDRLELCLEPYGHFAIEINVEKNAGSMLPSSKCGSKSSHKPFSGQGHSLRASTSQEERMPTDVPMSPKRHEARRLNTMCDPAVHQESIEEEDEEESEAQEMKEEDQTAAKLTSHLLNPSQRSRHLPLGNWNSGMHNLLPAPEARLVRKGPGYSELSPIPENASNERTDMLQQLVSKIEQACETMGQEAQAIGEGIHASQGTMASHTGPASTLASSAPLSCSPLLSSRASAPVSHTQSLTNQTQNNKCDHLSFMKSASAEDVHANMADISATTAPSFTSQTHLQCSESRTQADLNAHSSVTQISQGSEHLSCPTTRTVSQASQPGDLLQANASMVAALAGQVASDIAAMDTDLMSDQIGEPQEVRKIDGTDDDKMEAESVSLALEKQDSTAMDMDSMQESQTSMEDQPPASAEVAGELDDLYIKEPSPDRAVSISNIDTSAPEGMESP